MGKFNSERTMNNNLKTCVFMVITGLCLPLSGCGNYVQPDLGAVAREDSRIALDASGIQQGTFKHKDVTVEYTIEGDGEGSEFTYTGTLSFDLSLTATFPIIRKFAIKLNFLDSDGRVLEVVDVTPFFATFKSAPDTLTARKTGIRPPGSTQIAFNYYGVFKGEFSDITEDWNIFYMPFD
jgi:hypothetical protein